MNKKGFTLIELLATVIIVGILLLVAVPAVTSFFKQGTNSYYNSLEDTVLLAGREYLNDYKTLLPKEIGNVTVVELNELVGNKYIDNVVDNNKENCDAKVTVKKTGKNEYEYYTCLICDGYQSEGNNCEYSEDENITQETKNYTVTVDKTNYTVNQGDTFNVPTAKAYYLGQLVDENVIGSPRTVDTNKVGTTTITYAYKGAKNQITVEVIDIVSPTIPQVVLKYDNKEGKQYTGGWYNKNIYEEFKSTDYTKQGLNGSGIAYYEISQDQKNWTKITNNYRTNNINGNNTYYIRSVDKSNNKSESNSYNVKIDQQDPECTIKVTGTEGKNGWYTSNVTLELIGTDKVSSVEKALNIISKNSITSNTESEKITGMVTDLAGNTGTCEKSVSVDTKKPETPTITASDSITTNNWHTNDFTLTFSGSTSTSKITYYYGTTNNPTTKGSSVKISSETSNTTYYVKACNGAGTCSNLAEYKVKLDKQDPNFTKSVTGNYLSKKITISNVSDNLSNFGTKPYSYDGGTTWVSETSKSYTENQTVSVCVKDQAGNKKCENATISNMDTKTPEITANNSSIGLETNQDYDFTNNVTAKFGSAGGTVSCSPKNNSTIGSGTVTVTCTATGTNTLTSSVSFTVKHSYEATGTKKTYAATDIGHKHTGNSSSGGGCYTKEKISKCTSTSFRSWATGYGDTYIFVCKYCGTQHNNQTKWGPGTCNAQIKSYEPACGKSESIQYTCPDGGTLSGTTCTKIVYTCPNGGTLNGTTCEF